MAVSPVLSRFLVILAVLAAIPAIAWANSLDTFRAQGVIAERHDGLVEIRDPGAPAEAERLVEQVNQQRRALYRERASEQGVPESEVAKLYAEQIVQRAPAGTYFRQPDGSYIRK